VRISSLGALYYYKKVGDLTELERFKKAEKYLLLGREDSAQYNLLALIYLSYPEEFNMTKKDAYFKSYGLFCAAYAEKGIDNNLRQIALDNMHENLKILDLDDDYKDINNKNKIDQSITKIKSNTAEFSTKIDSEKKETQSFELIIEEKMKADFQRYLENNPKLETEIIPELLGNPCQLKGSGKPEVLIGNYRGCFSRRINQKDRIIYRVEPGKVIILEFGGHYKLSK